MIHILFHPQIFWQPSKPPPIVQQQMEDNSAAPINHHPSTEEQCQMQGHVSTSNISTNTNPSTTNVSLIVQ